MEARTAPSRTHPLRAQRAGRRLVAVLAAALLAGACGEPEATPDGASRAAAAAGPRNVILATTTSAYDSGLLDALVPVFERSSGYRLKAIPVGTGQALAMAARGDADLVLAHAPELEQRYVDEGVLVRRRAVMRNDFVIVGPPDDPAAAAGATSSAEALRRIAASDAPFASRGDDSGTHVMERRLWQLAGVSPRPGAYLEVGQGMAATLLVASEKRAYTLTDRATYRTLRKRLALDPVLEDDPPLLNLYSVLEVSPERFPRVNAAGARAFADFLVSPEGQGLIAGFGRSVYGAALFQPAAAAHANVRVD